MYVFRLRFLLGLIIWIKKEAGFYGKIVCFKNREEIG
jgi:hypothetical protein